MCMDYKFNEHIDNLEKLLKSIGDNQGLTCEYAEGFNAVVAQQPATVEHVGWNIAYEHYGTHIFFRIDKFTTLNMLARAMCATQPDVKQWCVVEIYSTE